MNLIKLGLAGLSPSDLVSKAHSLVDNMTGNEHFPTPHPPLQDIIAKAEELQISIGRAKWDRRELNIRKTRYKALAHLLRVLAQYVSFTAEDNVDILASSGFEIRKTPEPITQINRPVEFDAVRGAYLGHVNLFWKHVHGAQNYQIEISTDPKDDPNAVWTVVGVTSKSKFVVTDLKPGQPFNFRIRANGARLFSPYAVTYIEAA